MGGSSILAGGYTPRRIEATRSRPRLDGCLAPGERMAGEQPPQGFGVDPSPPERRVKAAPSATMRCLEAQVNRRREGGVRTEDGVGELEESVAPGVEAFVERVAEAMESIGRFHDGHIMPSPRALRTPYLPVELKRKLSVRSTSMVHALTLPLALFHPSAWKVHSQKFGLPLYGVLRSPLRLLQVPNMLLLRP
jgi:hypothetical protein